MTKWFCEILSEKEPNENSSDGFSHGFSYWANRVTRFCHGTIRNIHFPNKNDRRMDFLWVPNAQRTGYLSSNDFFSN